MLRFDCGLSSAFCTLALVALAASVGCRRSDIVPVSGRVTLDGQPLPGAVVVFQPVSGRYDDDSPGKPATGSVGRTDAIGRYELQLVEPPRSGALVGWHVVTITSSSTTAGGGDATARQKGDDAASSAMARIPKAWRDGSRRFEVPPGGTTQADFELTSD